MLEGLRRARVIKVKRKTPYPQLEIAPVVDEASTDLVGCTRDIARVLAFAENIVGELGEEAAPLMQRLRSLANQPGALLEALACFAHRGLNMSRIESRPSKREMGEYIFFVDLELSQGPEPLQQAIAELQPLCEHLAVFGAYPITQIADVEA